MRKFLTRSGELELPVIPHISKDIFMASIGNELLSRCATILEINTNRIVFNTSWMLFKYISDPLVGVSSGSIEVIETKNKYTIIYELDLKHIFWICGLLLSILLFFSYSKDESMQNIMFHAIVLACLSCLAYFMYYIYIDSIFERIIIQASEHDFISS